MNILKLAALLAIVSITSMAQVATEFDNLGGNQIILDKAKELNPETKIEVVQDRIVNRRRRFELATEFSGTMGGDDTYSKTQNAGLNLNYHFNHSWSLGLKYNQSYNKLTAEGESMVDAAYADFLAHPKDSKYPIPEVDFQKNETLLLLNWYPIYGKMNLFESSIVQFDVYGLLGLGNVELKSGRKNTYTAGSGIGFWLSQKITTRLELRYEKYNVEYTTGPKNLDLLIASAQLGWLL